MNIRKIVVEEFRRLKESRADQLRRELDNAVNGTDYGYTPKDTGEDPTIARGRGLEVDDEVSKQSTDTTEPKNNYNKTKVDFYPPPNGRPKRITVHPGMSIEVVYEFYKNGKLKSVLLKGENHIGLMESPIYIEYDDVHGRVVARQFVWEGKKYDSFKEWCTARYNDEEQAEDDNLSWVDYQYSVGDEVASNEEYYRQSAKHYYNDELRKAYLSSMDLEDFSDINTSYKFTKNRKPESDPRFSDLDLDDELPKNHPEEDNGMLSSKERNLKNWKKLQQSQTEPDERFANLDLNQYPKNSKSDDKELEQRAKGLELDENMKKIRMHFKRLLGNNKC